MKETLITYKTWRVTHNPWQNNNFIGNLDPTNPEESDLINEIHNYIDDYFNPRLLGVTDPDRFLVLMNNKLISIESNFFNSLMLDKNYDNILSMLKTIDMKSVTDTDTSLNGNNKSTITNKRTDNLTTTKSSRQDTKTDTAEQTETMGARTDTRESTNGGSVSKDTTYGEDVKTDSTTYGKKETQGGSTNTTNNQTTNTKNRNVVSQTPQSNLGQTVVGVNAELDWNYASGVQDANNNQTTSGTNNVTHGLTNTLSGTDTVTSSRQSRTDSEVTQDNRTDTENVVTGEQTNTANGTANSTFNEGEQSVTNTGTQDNATSEDRTHSQTGKYNKTNDNSGRTDNLATIKSQWRELLHKTMSAYSYLFEQLNDLFISVWDIDDYYFDII